MDPEEFKQTEDTEKLRELVLRALESGKSTINLFFLLNLSVQLSDAGLHNAKCLITRIVDLFDFDAGSFSKSRTAIWLYQYADDIKAVVAACTDVKHFRSSVAGIERVAGGANLQKALTTVLSKMKSG